jgi:hypothetical protein
MFIGFSCFDFLYMEQEGHRETEMVWSFPEFTNNINKTEAHLRMAINVIDIHLLITDSAFSPVSFQCQLLKLWIQFKQDSLKVESYTWLGTCLHRTNLDTEGNADILNIHAAIK